MGIFSRQALLYIRFLAKPVMVLTDSVLLVVALITALSLRFEVAPLSSICKYYLLKHQHSLLIVLAVYLLLFSVFRLYSYTWRFSSIEVLWSVFYANLAGIFSLLVITVSLDAGTLPRSVIIIFWVLSMGMISSFRVLLRLASVRLCAIMAMKAKADTKPKRVIILGAGSQAARVLRVIKNDPSLHYEIVGFLGDNNEKCGTYIGNVRILGTIEQLVHHLSKNDIDEVIVAMSELALENIRPYILECRKQGTPVKVVPNMGDALNGRQHLRLEDISVEDLLQREPCNTNVEEFSGYLNERIVLVTGAGGSIGSELCRQIMRFNPAKLILLGHGENSIFDIRQELIRSYPDMAERILPVIACISNVIRINGVFEKYSPEVVFHAAAHKHVPLMEENVAEAVNNNVLGTANIVKACGEYNVSRMVLVSTDKAADPHSIMGATKWLCENIAYTGAKRWPWTSFIIVRFGNVLGSRGSVIPVFKEQIRNGGPVTVTHPEMTRYFMTIPEASRLVLQAGAVGRSGELYLLDMGKPVRILNLAKDMIKLCGLEPGRDIEIKFTGMRPGEKLHEQLASSRENIQPSEWDGLSIVRRTSYFIPEEIHQLLSRLREYVTNGDDHAIREIFEEAIPGFAERAKLNSAKDVHRKTSVHAS